MAQKIVAKSLLDLTMNIGNYQIGGSVLQFEDSNTPLPYKGTISNQLLGQNAALSGKKLKIITTVLDSNPATNNIVITFGFQGTTASPIVIQDTAGNTGD